MPEKLVDAIVHHPDWRLRRDLTWNMSLGPEIRSRLAADSDLRVRGNLVEQCHYRWQVSTREPRTPLTVEAHELLAADPERRVREEVALQPYTPTHVRDLLTTDPDPAVRLWLTDVWSWLSDKAKAALLSDADPEVRQAAEEKHRPPRVIESEFGLSPDVLERATLARPAAERLARDGNARVRATAAANPSIPDDLVAELAVDADPEVRLAVSRRPELTEEQRAAIDYTDDAGRRFHPLTWVTDECEDGAVMRRCAASAHPALRRSAAFCPHLPADLVQALAGDEDFLVRLFLAENHPDPPGELLLRTILEFEGYTETKMLRHPNFPRAGLRSFADSSVARERALVAMDPDATSETVGKLSHDPDLEVRRTAAADARLPTPRLLELLADDETAQAAATNPSLPIEAMEKILSR
ncbi:LRV domain-containing protein [Actinomadura sp. BRA 177]|uniref:LRV domain-containing protein n=1 Tax=Actinomadura sp. BRA 177 TaxID=2745202 RepID=UPI0015950D38|nr:LRV domain-containing protein [Actinomadura sp. BRA 177]